MKIYSAFAIGLVSLCGFLHAALAAEDPDQNGKVIEKPVAADTSEKFEVVAASIRSQMGTDGRYEFISPANKVKVEADLDAMAAMLQKAGSVVAMRQEQKVQLFNTQENLNGILTHSDRNRLICEHNAPVGTHIPITTCKTVAEAERDRRDAQNFKEHTMMGGDQCAGTKSLGMTTGMSAGCGKGGG